MGIRMTAAESSGDSTLSAFSQDILKIEICGPDVSFPVLGNLTLELIPMLILTV